MREPKLVLVKPSDMKNANKTNHTMSDPKPAKHSLSVKVPVITVIQILIRETEPIGSGLVIIPKIVIIKIINKCHACKLTPSGAGNCQSMKPAKK